MSETLNDWIDTSSRTFMIGLSAFVWIVIAKLVAASAGPWLPKPVSDLIALV